MELLLTISQTNHYL